MSARCRECGGDTVWDDAAASEICVSCGSLADPAQVILTNQDWRSDLLHDLRDPVAPNILKSRSNYTLAGQGQALRDQKNQITMGLFIKSLAASMNAPGLTPRATTLFNQARAIGYFRWGSRARTVAGACLSLALREASRPDSIHDIATLLRCSPHLLSRTFISLTSALKITTLNVDPSVYIATLQSYLTTILEQGDQVASKELPEPLLKSIRRLSFVSVTNTAQSLGRVLSRKRASDTTSSRSSAASTACALFMLSLESENRDTLHGPGDLAKCLASRCHIGKGVVMSQYKVIQDQVAELIEKVPWLEGYRQEKGRAKASKRLVVARGLKDVIRFDEEIFHNILLPEIRLELGSDEKDEVDDQEPSPGGGEEKCAVQRSQPASAADSRRPGSDDRPTKKRKIHHSLDEASRFLLNPFNPPVSSSTSSTKAGRVSAQANSSLSRFPLPSYVLSTSCLASALGRKPPTRLQLLAVSRGGSGEIAIRDDELFDEGELEGMLRNEEEVATMRQILQFDDDESDDDEDLARCKERVPTSGKAKICARRNVQSEDVQGAPHLKTSKINLEAFAKFMEGAAHEGEGVNSDLDAEGETDYDDYEDANVGFSLLGLDDALGFAENNSMTVVPNSDIGNRSPLTSVLGAGSMSVSGGEEEVVLDGWRPASPSGPVSFADRYEEEYD